MWVTFRHTHFDSSGSVLRRRGRRMRRRRRRKKSKRRETLWRKSEEAKYHCSRWPLTDGHISHPEQWLCPKRGPEWPPNFNLPFLHRRDNSGRAAWMARGCSSLKRFKVYLTCPSEVKEQTGEEERASKRGRGRRRMRRENLRLKTTGNKGNFQSTIHKPGHEATSLCVANSQIE